MSVSNDEVYINNNRYQYFNFKEQIYKFDLSNSTNTNHQLYFSRDPYSITPYYDTSVNMIGTPGQPGSYTYIDIPSDFSGNLYYLNAASVLERDFTYYVKLAYNAYNQPAFAFATNQSGPYYNQVNLSFNSPNKYYFEYYFDMADQSGNLHSYELDFGTVVDSSTVYTGTVRKETTPGEYRSAVYLDLSSYSGSTLYAYHDGSANMGYSPPPANPDFTYIVTVSGGIFYLDGVQYPLIDFDANKTYLFIQSDSTNVGYPMIFGRLPDDTQNIIEDGVKIVGSLGQPEAYTLVTTPADFNDSMFYFHATLENKGPEVVFDVSYTVKIVQNILDEFVYSVSTAGGPYYNQPDISFTGPNKRYYFEVSDFYTNNSRKLVFGTTIDDISSVYTGIVYSDPNNSDGQFILLDLTDYHGTPLYMFDEYTAAMGYVPYDANGNIFNVTMSTDQLYIFLDTVESPNINFQAGQSYVFLQNDTTNVSYQLMFSQTYGMLPYYVQNYTIIGSLGRPGAYTQIQVPSSFSGSLFYFLKSLTREFTYHMKVNPNYLNENVFTISENSAIGPYYNQSYLTFTPPNRYYFHVDDSTNTGYELVFGSTADASNTLVSSSFITRGRTPGNGNNAFVYLDCSTHNSTFLYYFDLSYANMGWYELQPIEGGTFTNNTTLHAITVSNGDFYRNTDRYPIIDFVNGVTQKFTQDDSTNTGYQTYFSKDPYLYTSPPYSDIQVAIVGNAGQVGSQTSVYVPNALTENLYYIHQQVEISRSHKYYVKRVYNAYNEPAFSFSTTYDGSYVQQQDLSFTANNQYYFEYFFDTSNPSSNTHYYQLSFGETVDSTNVYTSTLTYKETIEGSYRSAVYLDLSGYVGNTLYAYNLIKPHMGYSPPPVSPDFSYNVSVSGDIFYLNNIAAPYIDFDINKSYLFVQSDTTNNNNPIIFGKLPDDPTTTVKDFIKIVGTPGTSDAYTLVTIPSDFTDSLYYFHPTVSGKGPSLQYDISHQIIVQQNVKGENIYAIEFPSEPGVSTNYETTIVSASWSQTSIDISGVNVNDSFGTSVSSNSTGSIIAIAAPDNDTSGNSSGHVRIFELINGTWTQLGGTIYGEFAFDYLGTSISLSSVGHTIAIGSPGQNGDAKVYSYNGSTTWYLVGTAIAGDNNNDGFGKSIALNDDGTIVACGGEIGGANGSYSGYVKIYQHDGITWNKLGNNLNGDNVYDYFGSSLTMSNDGTKIAIGAPQSQVGTSNNGYVKAFAWTGSVWGQYGNTITGTTTGDHFGISVSMNGTGTRIAIGGINHTTSNGSNSGHVQVYDIDNATWSQVGSDIDGATQDDQFGCSVSLNDDGTILAIGGKNNDTNGSNSGHVQVYKWNNFNWVLLGSTFNGQSANDLFGHAVALNKAGSRLVIGSPSSDLYGVNTGLVQMYDLTASYSTRYNGPKEYYNQPVITFSAPNKYLFTIPQSVYTRTLHQIGTDIEGQASDDYFGSSTALSADGTILAIGAPNNDTSGSNSGEVRVYVWNGTTWNQQGSALNGQAADDLFGTSVSLSSDGSILAVGSHLHDNGGTNKGRVDVYSWSGSAWISKGSALNGTNDEDQFGHHIQLSEDGNTLAIGARLHDTSGTDSGQVKVYIWSNNAWVQRGNAINGINSYDYLGHSVTLSSDGRIVAIGSIYSDVNTTNDGAVYVYIWDNYEWTARGEILNGAADTNEFGHSIHLSSDGDTLAISGIKNDNNGTYSGATYVYKWNGVTWTQKGSTLYGEAANDYFGYAVRLSSDGNTLVSSAHMNNGNGTDSGHVRIYKYSGSNWSQILNDIDGEAANDQSGYSLSLSADGKIIAIGARYNDGNGSNSGHVRIYKVGYHKPVFGTTPEDKTTIYNGTLYSDEFQSSVYVYLDLTDYSGNDLHIFNETTVNMGYVSPITPNNAYAVTMSSNQYHIFLEGIDNPTINFQAGQTYLFTQDDSSNVEYQIVFGATHGKVPLYETNYIIMGSLGRPGAYTQLSLPSDFTGNMDYFLKSLIRDTNYFVKVVTNHLNKPVLAIADTLNGTYYRQPDISFSSPNIYFFDVADVTNDAHILEFGTSYDSSNNSATIIRSRDPGVSGAFTFLDLSTYSGNTLYYSSDVSSGMGFNPYVLDTNTLITYPNENDNFNSILDTSYSAPFTYTKENVLSDFTISTITTNYSAYHHHQTISNSNTIFDGDYVASSSDNVQGYTSYNLFLYNLSTSIYHYHSENGYYGGSYTFTGNVTTNGIKGAWVQLILPSHLKVNVTKISFTDRPNTAMRRPDIGYLFGSNDAGNTWSLIKEISQNGTAITSVNISTTLYFNALRFVCNSVNGPGPTVFNVSRWNITGVYLDNTTNQSVTTTIPNSTVNFNSVVGEILQTATTLSFQGAQPTYASSSSIGQGLPTKITITPGNTTNADSNGINSIYLTNGITQMTESINPVGTIFYKNTPTSIEYNLMNTGSQLLTDGIRIGVNNNTIRIQHIKLEIMTSLDFWTTVMDASYSVITNGIKINENSFHIFPFTQQIDLKQFTVNSTNYTPYMMYQGAHNLFKYNQTTTTNFFHPGTASYSPDYTGAVVTNGVYGEWIQYEIPSVAKIRKYSFTPRSYTESTGLPDEGSLFGSTDGTTWTLIDAVSQSGTPITAVSVYDTNDYNHFRFVATSVTSYNSSYSTYPYFDPARWNLQLSFNTTKPIIAVTISNNDILLDGTVTNQFSYEAGQKYVFDQSDSTNSGSILYFSYSPFQIDPQYTQGVISVGTPGQPSAYTEFTVSQNLTDTIYVIIPAKEIYRDFTYFVKVENNALGEPVFSIATDRTGNYIIQKDLSLNSPNIYYFDLVDSTNSIATIQFGTIFDISASINTADVSYNDTPGTGQAYALVDLSGYTGNTLYYFNADIPNMGYMPVTSSIDFSYNVTVSNEQFYLNGVAAPEIDFEPGKNYYFDQTHPSNTGYPFVLGKQPDSAVDIYGDNFVTVGTAGQNEAYSIATLPTDFTGDLFYYSTDISGMGNPMLIDETYYVRVTQNAVGQDIFSISQNTSSGPYYDQESLPLTTPNRYYFDTSDPTNDGFQIFFGTQSDNAGTSHTRNVTYMNNNSAAYVNLSNYLGGTLYYFGADISNVVNTSTGEIEPDVSYNNNMGYTPAPVLQEDEGDGYVVTVSYNMFYIDGQAKTSINFSPGQIYLFDQSDPSNLGNQITFGRLPDDTDNILTTGVTIVGTAGRPDAYTSVQLPNDFKDALFYFNQNVSSMGNDLLIDTTYYVKVVQNILGENVFAFSTSSSGPFYNQSNLTFTAPTRYYLDVSDPSNLGYTIVFGTEVDNASTIYTGTTYDQIVDGNAGAFVYLDLADYTGDTLYIFEQSNASMGYVPPPVTSNTYNVTMSTDQQNIYLDNVIHPTINFTFGETYVFKQDHATNQNYEILFAETKYKAPLYTNNTLKVVGSLGQTGAYTAITIPTTYFNTLYYFVRSRLADVTYYVRVVNNALGEPVYSFATELNARRYYNQEIITFTPNTTYHFDVQHSSNVGYKLRFGTTFDDSNSINESVVTRSTSINPGSTDSFVYLDLTDYSGNTLTYFDDSVANMGYKPPDVIPSSEYVIQVSVQDEIRSFDKVIPAFAASQDYLLWQNDYTNDGYDSMVAGRVPSSTVLYTNSVQVFGTPGQVGAYTLIRLPSNFTGLLYSYVLTEYPRDIKLYTKLGTIPRTGDSVYSFANSRNGNYQINQTNLLESPNRYFINTDDPDVQSNNLIFGTIIDEEDSVPSNVQIYNTFIYIDMSSYNGDSIQYFDGTTENMGDVRSALDIGLGKPSASVRESPVKDKRNYTKDKIKSFLDRTDESTEELVLNKDLMVGYTLSERVSDILVVTDSSTFNKFDLTSRAVYALLENINDSLSVPTRSDSVNITYIGNDTYNITNTNGVLVQTLQSGDTTTYDMLKIAVGSALVELDQTIICFKRDTKILCLTENTFEEKYIKIQQLKPGMLVKTYKHGFVPLYSIGHRTMKNTSDNKRIKKRLYECNSQNYPEVFETLVLTGCHSILKDSIGTELRREIKKETKGKIYCTDGKYRVMSYLDEKAKPYKKAGEFEIWHFSLEHPDDYMNYGIYANGLLVETASKRMMADYSDMVLKYK